jgi:hypothetical protein
MTENVEKVVKEPQNPTPNMSLVCAVKQGSEFTKTVYKLVCKRFTKPCKQSLQTTSSQVNPALQCLKTCLQTISKLS